MKLPRALPAKRVIRAFDRLGFLPHHQTGSHLVLRRPADGKRLVVPMHSALDTGTLHKLIKQAQCALEEFLAAL